MLSPNNIEIFEWFYAHAGLIGWPTLAVFVWKASKWITEVTQVATKTVAQIDKMATNCFPTMQESLKTQDGLMHSMDQSLKTLVDRTPKTRKK
jgi:hypothetical protein